MRILLLLTILLPSLALAGLVEVNSSQYLRESGNPQAQYLEVTLDNAGEIRVSNVNLQDGYIELAASTDVLLNGSSLMQPFSLPTGGSAVFPLEAGTHYLEVTLRGKPGGGLKVSFYEDKPDAPVQGKGWELLDDGTVRSRQTGLIFHRNISSPGLVSNSDYDYCAKIGISDQWTADCQLTINEYITRLNNGDFGTDSATGNAGYTDWRVPTIDELASIIAWKAYPPIIGVEGEVSDPPLVVDQFNQPYFEALKPNGPFIFCFFISEELNQVAFGQPCDPSSEVTVVLSSTTVGNFFRPRNLTLYLNGFGGAGPLLEEQIGDVWPVRGGTSE